MSKGKRFLISCLILALVPGCWDRDYLKDARLIDMAAFDLAPNGKLLITVDLREMLTGGLEQAKPVNEIYSAVGNTPRETREILDDKIPGVLQAYKMRVLLIGEKLAKQNIYPLLDVFYRDPKKTPLNARIAVAEGKAGDLLGINIGQTTIGEYVDELIAGAELKSNVSKENIQTICPVMLDPGQDPLLPYLKLNGKEVNLGGLAMFHGLQFSGVLNSNESTLYLVMAGKMGEVTRFTKKVNPGSEKEPTHYITFEVLESKRDWKVQVDRTGEVHVSLDVNLKVNVDEYPRNRLTKSREITRLNRTLSKIMTGEAEKVIRKMQKARCDGFGVGRKLISYHPEVWKQKDWSRDYPKVRFHPKLTVEIIRYGVID